MSRLSLPSVCLVLSALSCDSDSGSVKPDPYRQFEIQGSQYDENRHYFLGHFFRDNYEKWLETTPQITSGVKVSHLDIYTLNRAGETEDVRNIVALMDLGEAIRIHAPEIISNQNQPTGNPAWNGANNLFSHLTEYGFEHADVDLQLKFPSFQRGVDYLKVSSARKLDDIEFTVNLDLGYMTLLRRLADDEFLAVSYQYSHNGNVYQVGEMISDYFDREHDEVIYLKMLKPHVVSTEVNTWDLMMKNIYSFNATQVQREEFELDILYRDDVSGQDFFSLPEGLLLTGVPLVEVLGLDRLNQTHDRLSDGNFDFIEGITIDTRNGNIIFPVVEPFGSHLQSWFDIDTEGHLIEKYVYDELYSNTKATVEQGAKNKFVISGKLLKN